MDMLLNKWEDEIPILVEQFKGIMVSCSGGIDSTVLLDLLYHFLKPKKKIPLAIFHMNFGLRAEESQLDQQFLLDRAKLYDIPFYTKTIASPDQPKSHIQVWARDLRYKELQRFINEGWLIALGHHQDDLAENILLRLARGVGPNSLMGMSEFHPPFWRPLLSFSKEQLKNHAIRHKLPYRHDSSNDTMKYSRNVIRQLILPELERLYPGCSKRMVRYALETAELIKFSKAQMNTLVEKMKTEGASLGSLSSLPNAVLYEIFSCALGRRAKPINHRVLEDIVKKIKNTTPSQKSWAITVGQDLSLAREGDLVKLLACHAPTKKLRYSQHKASFQTLGFGFILGSGQKVEFDATNNAVSLTTYNRGPNSKGFTLIQSPLSA